MGHGAGAALLHRQAGLGAVKGLDLGFLIDRQHDGMGRRVDIETNDVPELLGELRVLRQLETADAVRLQAMRLPDTLDRRGADADGLGHQAQRPMGRFPRWIGGGEINHTLDDGSRSGCLARPAGLIAQEPGKPLSHEAFLPAPDHRLGQPRAADDFGGSTAIPSRQDDLGAGDMLLRAVAITDDGLQSAAILRSYVDDDPCSHAASMNCFAHSGNPLNEAIH